MNRYISWYEVNYLNLIYRRKEIYSLIWFITGSDGRKRKSACTLNIRAESRMLANSQSSRARGRLQKISHPLVVYLQVTETEFIWRYVTARLWSITFVPSVRFSISNLLFLFDLMILTLLENFQFSTIFSPPQNHQTYGYNPLCRPTPIIHAFDTTICQRKRREEEATIDR